MKIAIAGYGLEGKANYDYWNSRWNELTIVDERVNLDGIPNEVKTILGPGVFDNLYDFDIVVRTAGLSPHKIKTNGLIWSSTNEFFAKCPTKQVIGVTGTKGKGTTCSMIVNILRAAGKTVHLVGNIGTPALAELTKISEDDVVVYELSSFQLWDLQKSPHIAVILGIEADHLDVHKDFNEYISAKANITMQQSESDVVIVNEENKFSRQISNNTKASRLFYPTTEAAHLYDGWFYYADKKICPISHLNVPGDHNIENLCAALTASWNITQNTALISNGIASFQGLPHRIKFVRELRGVKYYDDSYSSAPAASVAAIRAFKQPEIIILGGYDKGGDFASLGDEVVWARKYKKTNTHGPDSPRNGKNFSSKGYSN